MIPRAETAEHGDYLAFGLHIHSEIALPELMPSSAEDGTAPEIMIRRGALPSSLDNARTIGAHFQVGDCDVLLDVPHVARFRVRAGEEMVVDHLAGVPERTVRVPLLGTALAILCLQRGLLPLHANAIEIDGCAVCFAGNSGAGKSMLAARFQNRRYAILGDDICVVSLDEGSGEALAWPGIPRLKLWRDGAEAIGHDLTGCEPLVDGIEKYQAPLSDRAAHARGPLPLRRVYILPDAQTSHADRTVRLVGRDAVRAILANTYRGWATTPMQIADNHFRLAVGIARAAEIFAAGRKWGLDVYEEEAERLERHVLS